MNTVLNTFTLLFQEKVALQRRSEALETAIDWYEDRIESYSRGCRIRPWKQRQIDRIQDKLDAAQEELTFVNDELVSYADVEEMQRDSFGFSVETSSLENGKAFTTLELNVEDSIYDDTFELGDKLTVIAGGSRTKTNGGKQSSWTRLNLTPVQNENGAITGFYGSSRLGRLATEYDNFSLSIRNEDNELLYTEELGVQVLA